MKKTHAVRNDGTNLMLVFTEPEGQDFWLRPGESAVLQADVESVDAEFVVKKNEDGITVWPSDAMGYIEVWQNDRPLECGHQRPERWS
jgi:hypothetical protein